MIDAAHFLRWEGDLIEEVNEFLEHESLSMPGCGRVSGYKDLLTLQAPGFNRNEIERRFRKLVIFPSSGPDIDLIQELCSPDIVCDFVGDQALLPYAGRHVGVEALICVVRAIAVEFEQSHCAVSELLIEEGHVAGRRKVEWRHRGTGCRGIVELADFVRFEDGLIAELIEFRDTITLLEMQGEMEAL
jgi:ketosteroid isomerase-like protein